MKSRVRTLLTLLALCIPTIGWCDLSIQPSTPGVKETVHLLVPATSLSEYDPSKTLISMSLNSITVSIQLYTDPFGAPVIPLDVVLGQFPSGGYDVSLVARSDPGSPVMNLGTTHFNVVAKGDPSQVAPIYDYSDLWWTPSESGWGLTINQHVSNNLVAAWFVYGPDFKPTWYVVLGGSWVYPNTFSGAVYRTTGPYWAGAFNPSNVVVTQAGSATLTFSDFSHAQFAYTIDGQTGSKTIQREPY